MKTPTEIQIAEFAAAELAIGALDQAAAEVTGPLERLFARQYKAALDLRDAELREWNESASCGPQDSRRMLYRCAEASSPYHLPEDGPCALYTPNLRAGVSICDACAAKAKAARAD